LGFRIGLDTKATVVAKRTAGLGRIVEQSIRIVAVGLRLSRKYEAPLSAKHNHVRLESELNETYSLAFAPGAVSSGHEITKRQRLYLGIRFHEERART
jgi:hypothetical protein